MAALTLFVAVPATASAASSKSKAPTKAQVQAKVDKATTAVKRVKRYARLGNDKAVARHLKIARSQSAAASKLARRMANRADTRSESLRAAQALTMAGVQYDDLVEAVTAVVDQVEGKTQTQVAKSIVPSLAGKQKIIEILNQILPQVPAAAQPIIASIIAGLSAGDANDVVNLDGALRSGVLPVDISAIVTQALGTATAMIDEAFGMIQSLLPMLPAAVQGPLAQVLDMVSEVVGTIVPTVLATVTGLIDTALASLPSVGATPASPGAGIAGVTNTVTGLLDNLLGGLLGGGGLVPST